MNRHSLLNKHIKNYRTPSRRIGVMVGILISALLILFYLFVDPARYAWVPKCPVKMAVGLDCPGCGSQRMLHALLHANFAEAWEANAMLLILSPYLLLLIVVEFLPRRSARLHSIVYGLPVTISVVSAIVAWGLLRNFMGW